MDGVDNRQSEVGAGRKGCNLGKGAAVGVSSMSDVWLLWQSSVGVESTMASVQESSNLGRVAADDVDRLQLDVGTSWASRKGVAVPRMVGTQVGEGTQFKQ